MMAQVGGCITSIATLYTSAQFTSLKEMEITDFLELFFSLIQFNQIHRKFQGVILVSFFLRN